MQTMKRTQLVTLCVFLYLSPQISYAQEERILRDQFAYETASEMYAVADTAAFTKNAASLIENINKELKRGTKLEDDKIWKNLEKLEPYRKCSEVHTAVSKWIEMAVENNKNLTDKNFILDPHSIINDYKEGDFEGVVKMSRRILLESSDKNKLSNSIRNNMALALMHQNKDLCALVELVYVWKFSKNQKEVYFPALINLTVVSERLGERDSALFLSDKLMEYTQKEMIKVPLINFNAAWYKDLERNENHDFYTGWIPNLQSNIAKNKQYDGIFENIDAFDPFDVAKYKAFINHVRFDYRYRPVSEIGWFGKAGLFGNNFRKGGAICLFVLAGIILWRLFRALLGSLRYSSKFKVISSIIGMLIFVCLFCLTAWGVSDMGISFAVIYFIIFLILCIRRYNKVIR